jgi:hypothetical protein
MIEWRIWIQATVTAIAVAFTSALPMRVKRDFSGWMMSGLVACAGAVGLFYSKDSPAPPPPIGPCGSGVPASLVIQYASAPLAVALNSHLAALQIQPLDVAGNPVHDVPITFTVPGAGPSGTFNVFTDPDTQTYIPTPTPLMTTVSTSSTCGAAAPVFIANDTPGDYQITVTSGPIMLQVAASNVVTAAVSAVNVFGGNQIAHVNAPFRQPWWAYPLRSTSQHPGPAARSPTARRAQPFSRMLSAGRMGQS